MTSLTGTMQFPEEPEWSHVDLWNPLVQQGRAYERHEVALRAAATRRRNKRLRAAEAKPRLLVDGDTGEVLDQPTLYREGGVEVLLPVGVTAADVPQAACRNDFVQVCRALYRAVQEHLRSRGLPPGAQLLWAELVIEADPETGAVMLTAAEVARRYEVNRATALRWMRRLEAESLVDLDLPRGRGRDGMVTVVNYAEVTRLDLWARVRQAELQVRRNVAPQSAYVASAQHSERAHRLSSSDAEPSVSVRLTERERAGVVSS